MHGTLVPYLARLAEAGRLAITDPDQAASHLIALTFSQINSRTMFGAIPLADAEIDRIVTSGVAVFVRAYRPA
ncbi:MAG: TetR/AcrR family transcriptional regulator C-terminal domain-containing protein [Streptosporangiaceae bacterium]